MGSRSGMRRTVRRAQQLIDLLMKEMLDGLVDRSRLSSEEWDKLFGAKQSMIANLQKLVSTLGDLPEAPSAQIAPQQQSQAAITPQEMEMLAAWLAERGA